jgi:LIVCS family branched-chain amino acid:cation transporter
MVAVVAEERGRSSLWSTGLAMFSMFFGAGNIVFPLALGQYTLDKNFYGILGLVITAVFVPLMGLLGMMLYGGNYFSFFQRIGKIPGFIVVLAILGLIGPFGGIPRCITISHSTLEAFDFAYFRWISLPLFSAISCLLIFLFTFRQRKILSLLGYVLTPVLLLSLGCIVVKGLWSMPAVPLSSHTGWATFSQGILEGYNTMDLLAAFFFSSVVLLCLQKQNQMGEKKKVLSVAILGALIAASLLSLVYVCFSFLAAGYSQELSQVASDHLLGTLAHRLLGAQAGLIASVAVCFACFTTEIALTAVIANFVHKTLFQEKIPYSFAIAATLFVSFLISTLHFNGISAFLVPILQLCYPALIVLTILNILHKIFDFQPVKRIFYGTILLTFITYLVI